MKLNQKFCGKILGEILILPNLENCSKQTWYKIIGFFNRIAGGRLEEGEAMYTMSFSHEMVHPCPNSLWFC